MKFKDLLIEAGQCDLGGKYDIQINLTDSYDTKFTLLIGENTQMLLVGGHGITRGVCHNISELGLNSKNILVAQKLQELRYEYPKDLRKATVELFKKSYMRVGKINDTRKN